MERITFCYEIDRNDLTGLFPRLYDFKIYIKMIREWLLYFNENLLLPILLSIISACIFWLFFDYYPRKRRYKKIRPKVEFDLYQMHLDLFFYCLVPFRINSGMSFGNQSEVAAGCLIKEEIELWLQDKCLNDSYKYDENQHLLISIGGELEKFALKFSEKLKKAMDFNAYLSVEEILLLQQIEYKLSIYSYQGTAESKIGNKVYHPLNPNLAYMAGNMHEIYRLYLTLRERVLDFKLISKNLNNESLPNFNLEKTVGFYHRGQYKKCIQLSKKIKEDGINWVYYKCLLKLGRKKEAYKNLRSSLNSTTLELVSLRNYLAPEIFEDTEVLNVCKELRGEIELKYCITTIREEVALREYYEKQNLAIKAHYDAKLKESAAKGKKRYEEMKKNL